MLKMNTDDKYDNQSDGSAASADSGVILNDRLMSNTKQCNVDIKTSVKCNSKTIPEDARINIENIINLAKNVSSTKTRSSKKATPSNRSSSPTSSIRSTCISITSIHSDAVSSVIDSDCDDSEDSNGNYRITKLGHQTSNVPSDGACSPSIGGTNNLVLLQQRIDGEDMDGALAMASTSMSCGSPQVGNMAFTNSTDITIGQKNYYQGPVTIQQFLIENRKRDTGSPGGFDNPTFESSTQSEEARKMACDKDKTSNHIPSNNKQYKFIFNRKAACITGLIVFCLIAIGVIIPTSSYMLKRSSKIDYDDEDSRKHIPVNTAIGNDNIGGGRFLRLVPRQEWLARPASGELDKLDLPVHRIIIAHTAQENCSTQATCSYRTKMAQEFHMDSNTWDDIGYNFLVGGDGAVYEGRGWDFVGAHTKGYNYDSICIAFIGTFTKLVPPERQLNATKLIIEEGVRLKKLVPDYRLYGTRQFFATQSPGDVLYEIIKKWPHWSSKIE